MLTFYYADGACSMASHIVLEETGAPYEPHRIALDRQENFSPAYRAINPRGKVPALVVDGDVLTENVAILTYLARAFPQARLLPDDLIGTCHCLETAAWLSNAVHPHWTRFRRTERFADDPVAHETVRQVGLRSFWNALKEIDERLARKTWMMGEHYTICDPYALVFLGWAKRGGLPVAELENYSGFARRMMQRPAVAAIIKREGNVLLESAAA